jgi:hypothetical protein
MVTQMLTYNLLKPRACSCQLQAGKPEASQMLTYNLLKTQCMPLSATIRKGQPDADLQPVQNPAHALISYKQGRASQMLTYILFKTQSKLLSVSSMEGQPDADLHSVQIPEHALVSNKQEGSARC